MKKLSIIGRDYHTDEIRVHFARSGPVEMPFPPRTLALTMLVIAACSQRPAVQPLAPVDWRALASPVKPAAVTAPTARERDAVDAYVASLASSHFALMAPTLDADARGWFPGIDEVRGRDDVVHLHELLFGGFYDRRVAVSRIFSTAGTHSIEWMMTGRQEQQWMRVAPTGRSVAFKGITLIWTSDDGAISDLHVYFDEAAVRAELGVGPERLRDLPPPRETAGTERVEQTGTTVETQNVAAVRAELDALENKDEAAYLSSMTDDVVIDTPEGGQATRTKAGAKAYYESMDHAIGQLDTTIGNIWGIGTFVVVEYSIAGLQLAPLGWVPVRRNHVVGLHVVDVSELRGDRVARIWRYDDLQEVAIDGR